MKPRRSKQWRSVDFVDMMEKAAHAMAPANEGQLERIDDLLRALGRPPLERELTYGEASEFIRALQKVRGKVPIGRKRNS